MDYEDFKYLPQKTTSDKVLHDEAFGIAKNQQHDGYKRGIASVVYKFFDKKSATDTGKGLTSNLDSENQQLD